ncbi:MAG: hypothetical protein FWF44_06920 [Defluviitaleaceae bacterium]|nr:hypothetical protein [Defluviitaleaceae bacterium]
MNPESIIIRDFYAIKPDAPLYQKEFGFYVMDKWIEEGYVKGYDEFPDRNAHYAYLADMFGFDPPANAGLGGLGWCEAEMVPCFETKTLEDRGEYELVQDWAGRHVLYFKGRRNGFMPEYVSHPVKDMRTWEENVKWRLDPRTPERLEQRTDEIGRAAAGAAVGHMVVQGVAGGYMYLRSLIGPLELPYKFYDEPELIHDCMKAWFELADFITAYHQERLDIDELFLAEDICYNHGPLISPDMIKEFLFPYYQQLYTNMKRRARDRRPLHFQIDTDGFCEPVIDLYRTLGVDYFSPFEIAAGNDPIEVGKRYPDLRMSGGIDKRVLAQTTDDIDRYLDNLLPVMRRRGGFIPTCDHGVPEEVPFENYMYFRKRMLEYGK